MQLIQIIGLEWALFVWVYGQIVQYFSLEYGQSYFGHSDFQFLKYFPFLWSSVAFHVQLPTPGVFADIQPAHQKSVAVILISHTPCS